MAELIYRNVKNLPAVESKDDMNESDAIIVVQDETTKQASFADVRDAVRDAVIDLIDYSDVGADPVGSADDALVTAKAYTDREIDALNTSVTATYATKTENSQSLTDAKAYTDTEINKLDTSLSEDIANNTTAIQDLTTYADDTFETKTEVANTYATKTENAKTLTDAKAYTDQEIDALNTSVANTYATKTENSQSLTDAKAYTDTEINKLDTSVVSTYATKTENAKTLTDAKAYTDAALTDLVGTAPDKLNTLGEIADALKGNADIVDTIISQIPTKVSQLTNDSGYVTTNTDITGNAATATKLQTARTIALTGSVTGSGTFDGSGNLSIETTTNHTHNYAGSTSAGGAATKAISDSAGQQIDTTYIKELSTSGQTITITKGDGSTSTITTQDKNVTNTLATTTKAYLTGTTSATTNTGTQVFDTGVYLDTTAGSLVAGTVTATTFNGALSGNASTATKATQDSAGQQIDTTYIKELSVSGATVTITKGDGSTSTITTQDTNTDTKVTNTLATTTKAYLTGTTSDTTNTGTQVFDTGVYLDEEAGTLTASKFKGNLEGNANTATKLQTESTISLSGAITGSGAFDGSGNLNIETLVSHTHPYLPLAGGTMTGTISTSKTTGTKLAGNQGEAIINSTADAGAYTMLAKMNSANGYFTMGTSQNKYLLQYTAKSTVDAETNSVTYSATLLDESGRTRFPGTVYAAGGFNGKLETDIIRTRFVDNEFTAGEALAANDLIILDASTGTWFKSTTARTYVGVAMIATAENAYALGATVTANVAFQRRVTAATVGNLAANNLVLIQGTLGDDGVSFTTDGTITNTRIEGKEYIRAGYLQASSFITFSGTNPQILTWGSGGGSIDPETLEKLVTTDAEQTITGSKTFSGTNYVTGKMQQSGAFTDYTTYRFRNTAMGTSSTPTTDATYGGSGSIYIQYS